jgi:hypothetical protein
MSRFPGGWIFMILAGVLIKAQKFDKNYTLDQLTESLTTQNDKTITFSKDFSVFCARNGCAI